ncbi:MAG: hypothetical protein LBK13_02220, partial [Spirochaetales bacterium]|nr:hypothetical protein [Spirochaetales bacterium]
MTDIEKTLEKVKAESLPFESWERLAGEPGAAYAAFCAYRDYGPQRNIRRAVEAAEKNEANWGKRYRVWRNWSAAFRWRERAEEYDAWLDRLKQAERRKGIEEREAAYREVTGKMLSVVEKKLAVMEPGELSQGAVVEWTRTAIDTEREIFGLTAEKEKREAGPRQL